MEKTRFIGFTRMPNNIYDYLLLSKLPFPAKMMVMLVVRLTIGYNQRTCLLTWATLHRLIPTHPTRITRLIQGLIAMNILHGGACKTHHDGRISAWELSVNPDVTNWDIPVPSKNRTVYYSIQDQTRIWKQLQVELPNGPKIG